ncbi:MAG TPA: beta-xylosidase [Terriglobales bacterium]|nr:beta-xylosidase [Terriglobales bacterium]
MKLLLPVLLLSASFLSGQTNTVTIHVDASHTQANFPRVWNFFGYDEPNYTYAANGKKLLKEIAAFSPVPAHIRTHNLLTTGNGQASLKWGSTNAYTEDPAGNPVYDWKIVDRIFDTYHDLGLKPLVEIGFMPEAMSTHPEPYRHNFPNGSIYTGWAYPPKDYSKWAELVFQFARHLRERYGDAEVKTWLWEVWNEPDIDYWKGTPEEYFKLYDYSADAVLRALPGATIGGPDSTGPSRPKAVEFLRQFLEHCESGRNFATGKIGAPLDFISFHPKGSPTWQGDHVQMGLAAQLKAIDAGFKIVASFPKWRNTPVILGEWDPEGCAACSAEKNPQNGYRNGPLYAAYTAEALDRTLQLAEQDHIHLRGALTWAFEFEDQPYFAGFRELAANGLDKPVLNAFRMFGLLGEERVAVTSSSALATADVLRDGVRAQPDIGVIATRSNWSTASEKARAERKNGSQGIEILLWNYHDDDVSAPAASIDLTITGLPSNHDSSGNEHALLEHFRIDSTHSNAFSAWKSLASPQPPTPDQYRELESSGQLQLLTSPEWIDIHDENASVHFELPRQGVSLLRISW